MGHSRIILSLVLFIFTFFIIKEANACDNITTENYTLTLSNDVSSDGTCFNILANNITIDCQGYTINYSQSILGYAVNNSLGYNSTTVKNCNIVQGSNIGDANAIYIKDAYYTNITGNTINVYDTLDAIHFESSNSSTIFNNTITTFGYNAYAIYLYLTSDSNIINNIISTYDDLAYGILLSDDSNSNTISNNKIDIYGNSASGIYTVFSVSNSNITDNTITTSGSDSFGIELYDPFNSNITDNTITTSGSDSSGIYLNGGSDNTLINNNINNSTNGIWFDSGSNNTIYNNSIYSNNFDGIILEESSYNNITNNNVSLNSQNGIHLHYSNNNRIVNNTVDSNKWGIYVFNSSYDTLANNSLNDNTRNLYFEGEDPVYYDHTVQNNTVNGLPVYYYFSQENLVLSGLNTKHVTLANCSNITVSDMNTTKGDPIYVMWTNNSTLYNNTAEWNDIGIAVYFSNNNNIGNNTLSNNNLTVSSGEPGGSSGIQLVFSSGNFIYNNTADSNTLGIFVAFSDNTKISNNIVRNNAMTGIYIFSSSLGNLTLNNMSNNGMNLLVMGFDPSNYNHSIDTTNLVAGLPVRYYFNVQNFTFDGNINPTKHLTVAYGKNITINNTDVSAGDPMCLAFVNESELTNNTANYNFLGMLIIGSANNNITGGTNATLSSNMMGIMFIGSSNNLLYNYNITGNMGNDIGLMQNSMNNIIRSVDYNLISIDDMSNMTRQWILDMRVQNTNLDAIEGARIVGYDRYSAELFNTTTLPTGHLQWPLTEYNQNSTDQIYYTNYTLYTSKVGYVTEITSVNLTSNMDINITLSTLSTTTTTTIPSGPGGGTGPSAPSEKKKSQTWTKMTPGSTEIMHVNDPDIGLKMINITVRNPVKTITITVTKLAGKPASIVHNVSGKIYKYIEITPTNLPDENISSAKIQFQVNKSWITGNNIDKTKIYLNRYKNNAWQKLTTRMISEDATYVYYEAESPGFSTFAVTGEEITTTIVTTVATTIATTVATTTETTILVIPPKIGGIPTWILGVIIIIIVAIVLLVWKLMPKKRSLNISQFKIEPISE